MRNPQCNLCGRSKYAKQICVFGNSIASSSKDIMVIVDTISNNSDYTGIVTSGQGGNVLIKLFTDAGVLNRVYFTAAVKCYSSTKPKVGEVRKCRQYLLDEIQNIKPKLIITLGVTAAQAIFNKAVPIKSIRQRIFSTEDLKIGCTYSHSVIFTDPTKFSSVEKDIKWILNNYQSTKSQEVDIRTNWAQFNVDHLKSIYGFDIETTGLSVHTDKLLTYAISPNETITAYVRNLGHPKANIANIVNLNYDVCNVFGNPRIAIIGHNIKFDIKFIIKHLGIRFLCKAIDTSILHSLLDENSSDNSLKNLAAIYTEFGHYEDDIDKTNLVNEPFDKVSKYNGIDSIVPHQLLKVLWPQIQKQGLAPIASFLMEMIPIFVEMELTGIHINIIKLKKLFDSTIQNLNTLRTKYPEYDFKKTQHVAKLLYRVAKISEVTKTKTGKSSTDKDTLNLLKFQELNANQREILNDVLFHRGQTKILTTITGKKGFVANVINNRLHTTYNLAKSIDESGENKGAVTGRLSSSNPNLQNVPNKDDKTGTAIREIFEITPGWKYLVTPDYSQIELRVAAFLSREPVMINAYQNKYDIHTSVMCDLIQEDYSYVNKILKEKYPLDKYQTFHDYRLVIKRVNFGILYGIWIDRLLKVIRNMELNLTEQEAKNIINQWYKKHITLLDWIKKTEDLIIKNGEICSIFGRKRRLPGANGNTRFGKRLLRQGINFPIQSAASDICLIGIYNLDKLFKVAKEKGAPESRLNLTVHDQIIFETKLKDKEQINILCQKGMIDQTIELMKQRFNIDFDVPLEIDVGIDTCWR